MTAELGTTAARTPHWPWPWLVGFAAAIVLLGAALASPEPVHATTNPVWVNDLTYGSPGGGYYHDFISGLDWTSQREWHAFSPQPMRSDRIELWVNYLDYGSSGGGFYLDNASGLVWTAERGWHVFSPGLMMAATPYFFLGSNAGDGGGPFLVPVYREVPQTVAVARAAIEALLAGPSLGEATSVPAISSAVPAGTRLLDISITNGVASVNLSAEFASGAGAFSVRGRLAQLVYTLTRFPTVDSVRLLIEGQLVRTFSSEGVEIDAPLRRIDFIDFLPAILVDDPVYGGPARNPLRVTGNANVFEARFRLTLTDHDGLIIAETPVMVSCGTGCRGTFDVTVPYTVTSDQWGSLIVAELSAEDGHPTQVREYPVLLSPP